MINVRVLSISRLGLASRCLIAVFGFVVSSSLCADAKEPVLDGVELYAGPSGPAYAQITNLLLDGRIDLRECGAGGQIDRSQYSKLPRIVLSPGGMLEKRADGSLLWTKDSRSTCVVPGSLKLEKGDVLTPAALAEKGTLQGRVIVASAPGLQAPPPLKPGDKVVIVSDPTPEMDEYLRAQWAGTAPVWQDFLSKYPASAHADEAKRSLAELESQQGAVDLARFQSSSSGDSPDVQALRSAWAASQDALHLAADNPVAAKVGDSVRAELTNMAAKGSDELQAYRAAVVAHKAGYAHFTAARKIAEQIATVDERFAPGVALRRDVEVESHSLDTSLQSGEKLLASNQPDQALGAIRKYRFFAPENPRIAAIVNADYDFHLERGKAAETTQDWSSATQEYTKAKEVKDTPEVNAALNHASGLAQSAQFKRLADNAIQQSQQDITQRDTIHAYEVLADLPDGARQLVAEQMASLQSAYVQAASDQAKKLQQVHSPIAGKMDLAAMRQAYSYLERASSFGDDDNIKERLSLVADEISDYYVKQAKAYLEKPLASGVGLGWYYLDQAQLYRPDSPEVRDEKTKNANFYQIRSHLSVGVQFRDQTSRTDLKSAGFSEQLRDAIATGLESSGLPVSVFSMPPAPTVPPNFMLVGEILEHRPMRSEVPETLESKYRTGQRELPNPAWNKADADYTSATLEFQRAQSVLQGAQARNKKKEIEQANRMLLAAKQSVEAAQSKRDELPRTQQEDTVKPYSYTKTTLEIKPVVELSFRIRDLNGVATVGPVNVKEADTKKFVVLEGLNSNDTEGLKQKDARPSEDQLMGEAEIRARDRLVQSALEAVQSLPKKILERARAQVSASEIDDGAELYILYLNCTPADPTPEREEAKRFLRDNFNIQDSTKSHG
jgi:hypothetical protein